MRHKSTAGVLTAALDLAALVLVGVATFLGSEVVTALFGFLHVRSAITDAKNQPGLPTSI